MSYTESPQAEVPNAQMNEFLIDSKQLKVQHEGREQFTGNIPYPSGDCSGRPRYVLEDFHSSSWADYPDAMYVLGRRENFCLQVSQE